MVQLINREDLIRGLNHKSCHISFIHKMQRHTKCAGSMLSTDHAFALKSNPASQ